MNQWSEIEEAARDAGLPDDWFLGEFGDTEAALRLFRLERVRQVCAEGYSPAHDDAYGSGELLAAAQCYVLAAFVHGHGVDLEGDRMPSGWPWAPEHWKPSGGPLSCIVKAGALLLAEMERRQRAAADHAPGIELVQLDGHGDLQYMAKGHVDLSAFRRAIRDRYGHEIEPPCHIHMRKTPDPSGDYQYIAHECRPGPGAFKATFAMVSGTTE